jgi:hypothetical protein
MDCREIIFSGHAIRRMFERGINEEHVAQLIADGEPINDYPDDKPYPSVLLLGYVVRHPLHVVLGLDEKGKCYVITVYTPDPTLWDSGFRRKLR